MEKVRVLFVCSGPGVRARIAQAFVHKTAPDRIEAFSAQFENRNGYIPEFIKNLVEEVGLEIIEAFPVSVFGRHKSGQVFDFVITLCHASSTLVCPIFKSNVELLYKKNAEQLSWSIQDFRSLSDLSKDERMEKAREMRDMIAEEVQSLVKMIDSYSKSVVPENSQLSNQ